MNLKAGDTYPPLEATLQDSAGTPVNLDGATVKFSMKGRSDGILVINDADMVVLDASKGMVQYQWQAADTAEPGYFRGEIKVTFGDNTVIRIPNSEDLFIEISTAVN